ncbi:ABC transporter permease [Pseudoalteromonas tunicata]|uniref:ABC transporter permease n=1 Tax=Pseudoalteromonas tunicata TaxID=314281 RepID=UPI00273DAE2F|nr:ABC transporter permease [Pseudoalteromonas tunicata]MDP4984931.1 ABC transporter permease [Pseudoalteromonas tunicata]
MNYTLKVALMNIAKAPMYAMTVVSSLAITLGALGALMSISWVLFFKPLDYDLKSMLFVTEHQIFNQEQALISTQFSLPAANAWYELNTEQQNSPNVNGKTESSAFSPLKQQVILSYYIADVISSLANTPRVNSVYVSPNWVSTFDVPLVLGRDFSSVTHINDSLPEALISYEFWHTELSQTPDIIGQSIELRGVSYTIVGVVAENFVEPELFQTGRKTAVFLPWRFNWSIQMNWGQWTTPDEAIKVVSKIDVAHPQAAQMQFSFSAALNEVFKQGIANQNNYQDWHTKIKQTPLKETMFGPSQRFAMFVMIAALALFLIALVNVSNLVMAYNGAKHRTFAIHLSLGAQPSAIKQMLLIELSILLFLAFIFAGLIAYLGVYLFANYAGQWLAGMTQLRLTAQVVVILLLVLVSIALWFVYISARSIDFKHIIFSLKSSGKGVSQGINSVLRTSLVTSQIALCATIICLNISHFEQAAKLVFAKSNLPVEGLYQLRLSPKNPSGLGRMENIAQMQQLKLALLEQPTISDVSVSLSPLAWFGQFSITDVANTPYLPETKFIDEDYFRLLGQKLLRGDNFTQNQLVQRDKKVIVNETFAKMLAKNGEVLGQTITLFEQSYRIMGVVEDLVLPNQTRSIARLYAPDNGTRNNIMLKFKQKQQAMSRNELATLIGQLGSQYQLFSYQSLEKDKTQLLFLSNMTFYLTLILIIFTLFIGAAGLYAMVSFTVHERALEWGTRMALGAKGRDILRLLLGENSKALLLGFTFASVFLMLIISNTELLIVNISFGYSWLLTLTLILMVQVWACYAPLRRFITRPAMYSLRGLK